VDGGQPGERRVRRALAHRIVAWTFSVRCRMSRALSRSTPISRDVNNESKKR
jgi:hypothetical protein